MKPLVLMVFALLAAQATACAAQSHFTVTADDAPGGRFAQAQYYNNYGCTGGNISPHITWSGAPADTRSFAVTIFDPDAPTGHGWWHWLVTDIPATAAGLERGISGSDGLQALGIVETNNDFGTGTYGGPCPPPGSDHHYVITVYALKTDKLNLAPTTPPAEVEKQLKAAAEATATTTVMAAR
ncbi:MAG: YbhB/YbcL family Raf kinase inhibitor-like protein [Asticcacaulis sp.]|nr:YbhB/YbcL family Raf kinase inhibitor-like protein [Asticcacaulis sp.]